MSFHARKALPVKRRTRLFLLGGMLLGVLAGLGGCGKRPSQLDPPEGTTGQARVYPMPDKGGEP